ncbi:MAG: DUF1028 domain-containing protein [Fretibacterium sp.]|nr:DUF1028 domain-containing protein [Fretibacterium sp.]
MISTFSIIARDPVTGELGGAVQSKFLAAGSAVIWGKAGGGIIATQAMANLDFGEIGRAILAKGYSAERVAKALLELDPEKEHRQFGIVDANGGSYTYTGSSCFDYAGGICGENFAAQGNILVSEETVKALAETFQNTKGTLARRLVLAMDTAQDAGGDRRGRQSSALMVFKEGGSYGGFNDLAIDLRVDDDPEPIKKLIHLLDLHELYFNKSTPEEIIDLKSDDIKKIQAKLAEIGYYKGDSDGVWSKPTEKALFDFCGWENYEERFLTGSRIDKTVFAKLMEK